jgi:hypothetical protein
MLMSHNASSPWLALPTCVCVCVSDEKSNSKKIMEANFARGEFRREGMKRILHYFQGQV